MTDITLLDGSMGQELVHRHGQAPTPLWSTTVMMENPDLVRDVHADYFAAGATVATTNTYAILRDRLTGTGHEADFEALHDAAFRLAADARDAHGAGRVAYSLGPLGASYRSDITPPPEKAAGIYAEIVARHREDADLFLIETVASLTSAEGALLGCADAGKPVWLAVSVDDDDGTRLRSGEALADLGPIVAAHDPDAILINCSRPEAITAALGTVRGFGKPFGAYANGFTHISEGFLGDKPTVDALTARTDLGPAAYADFAMSWIDMGATIVGGCCEVGPAHIAEIATRLRAAGHRIV